MCRPQFTAHGEAVKKWDWLRAETAKTMENQRSRRCLSQFFHSLGVNAGWAEKLVARQKTTTEQKPLTAAQQLGSLVKSARDMMRKDEGLNGDLDRLPMLTWGMFLKLLDDLQAKVDQLKALHAQTAAELDALTPSILDRAFRGEL